MPRGKQQPTGPIGDASTIDSGPAQRRTMPLTPAVGAILGDRYQLVELLGVGSFGAVWRARDRVADEVVAVKLMAIDRSAPAQLERLRRELRAARKVLHSGVVRIHDLIEVGEHIVLSMELVEGETLEARVRRDGPLSASTWCALARDLAGGLDAAHEAGVAHRDLKPANVLLRRPGGRAVITDFGVSRLLGDDSPIDVGATEPARVELTAEGAIVGTPLYMAPEQLAGQPATRACDLYALGLVLHFAATGTPAGGGDTLAALRAARAQPAPGLAGLRGDLPSQATALVDRMLAVEPAARPSARAVATELAAPTRSPAAPRRRPRTVLWLGGAVAAVVATIALVVALRPARRAPAAAPPDRPLRLHLSAHAADPALARYEPVVAALAAQSLTDDLHIVVVDGARGADADLVLGFARTTTGASLHTTGTVRGAAVDLGEVEAGSVRAAVERAAPAMRELAAGAPARSPTEAELAEMEAIGASSYEAFQQYRAVEREGFSTVSVDPTHIVAAIEHVIALDPGWLHPYLHLVLAAGILGDPAAPAIARARADADPQRDPRGWQILAMIEHWRAGELAAARTTGEAVLDPRDMTGTFFLALVDQQLDQSDAQIGVLRRLHDAHPQMQFGYDLMMALSQSGRGEEIPRLIEAWSQRAPASQQALGAQIQLLSREQRWDDAVALARDFTFLHGSEPHQLVLQCDVLIGSGALDDARAIADRLITLDPISHARGLYRLGVIATLEGRFASASATLREALQAARPLGQNGETFQILRALIALPDLGDPGDRGTWLRELAETYELQGAASDAAAVRFELALVTRAPGAACPDLDDAVASLTDPRQRSRARVDALRAAAAHGCARCADVVLAGRSFREVAPESMLRFADCATREGEHRLAADAIADILARRVTSAGLGGTIDDPYLWTVAHYQAGRVAEARGDAEAARAAYRDFLARWAHADRAVPELAAARAALDRL